MIIDVFTHLIPGEVGELLNGPMKGAGRDAGYPDDNADPGVRLAMMDKYGIDMQVLTPATARVLQGYTPERAAEICRLSSNANNQLYKAYPDRFVNVCGISLLDMKSAMKELERCVKDLDCRGITVTTNQNGKGLDDAEYMPFYEKLVEYDLPLWLHPVHWESYPLVDMQKGWRMMATFGWPFDTTQAVWRMIFGGVFDRFPSLQVVMHHLGAMFPFFARRVNIIYEGSLKGITKYHVTEYFKRNIYGDTAVCGTKSAHMCGYEFFGADRMMFGTDYPFGPERGEDFIREGMACMKAMDIPEADKLKIYGGNAKKLLKII
ncbi:amidohydrolase family protein [Chloroflexota bacterium]